MAYKITGRVLSIGKIESLTAKSGNTYTKRDLVITVRKFDQYTGQPTDDEGNTPKFTFIGERCKDLDQFKVGDIVTVSFELNGRSYINRDNQTDYITDLRPTYVGLSKNAVQQTQQEAPQPFSNGEFPLPPALTNPQQPYAPMPDNAPTNAPIPTSDDLPF